MADIKIRIVTSAETKAVDETRKKVGSLGDTTKETGKEVGGKFFDAQNKATEGTKNFSHALRGLATQLPGIGQIAGLLVSPFALLTGAIAAAVGALVSYLNKIDDLAKAAEAHARLSTGLYTLGGGARDAAESLAKFKAELIAAAEKGEDLKVKLEAVNEAIQKGARMRDEMRDAREALAIEEVNAAEKSKKIGPLAAMKERGRIREDFAAKREADRRKLEDEIQEARNEGLRRQMETTVRAKAALPGAEREAAEAERGAGVAPKIKKSGLESIKEQREAVTEERDKAQTTLDAMKGVKFLEKIFGKPTSPTTEADKQDLQDKIDAAQSRLTGLDDQEEMVNRGPERAAELAKNKRARAEALKGIITTGTEREGAMFGEIISGNQNVETDRRHRTDVGALTRKTNQLADAAALSQANAAQEQEIRGLQERLFAELLRTGTGNTARIKQLSEQIARASESR